MAEHQKPITKDQKLIILVSAALVAIIAAVITVIILVHFVKNPPDAVLNSSTITNSFSSSSNYSSIPENLAQNPVSPDAPIIKGIKNGDTYYTSQYVIVSDSNLASVTVNGEISSKMFWLDGNCDNTYTIEASDTDGNTTKFTVYTKSISSLSEPINSLNEYTVTSDHLESIKQVKKFALDLDTKYSTLDETQLIDDIINICEKYIKKIDTVSEKIKELTKSVSELEKNEGNVNLAQIETDIEALLGTENITTEQRSTLQNLSNKCKSMMSYSSENDTIEQNIE